MFAMLSKVAEILAQFGHSFLTYRRHTRDTEIAALMLRCVTQIQDLCVRGQRLLDLAEQMMSGVEHRPVASEEFSELVREQAEAVDSLQSTLLDAQALLTTIDAQVYLELAPVLN